MTWEAYLQEFENILNNNQPPAPYDDAAYLEYTKLNHARLRRWTKSNFILDETAEILSAINNKQSWVVITEPWCGDAAHIVPILHQMAALNNQIDFSIQLRDTDSEIEKYLTNGTKSIPVLIVRDHSGNDIFRWGPRPKNAQDVFDELKNNQADFDTIKEALQKFYNQDKAISIQQEVIQLLEKRTSVPSM
ncbi:MAG: thioredoxin family protein [Chitinophagaceae bacterium]|nr:MAG: thioredoxin family protein [Chitinophagaceae bacterium]